MTGRPDVQSSLADMDRKLRELQRELALVSRRPEPPVPAPAPPPAAPPPPPAPAPVALPDEADAKAQAIVADARAEAARIVDEAAARVAAIGQQIDELQRLRDDLQRSARALVDEYERALRQAPDGEAAAAAAPTPLAHQEPPPASGTPPPPAAQRQFEGQVVVNAGPFTDIATLGAFEQALARLPQAEDVYVRGFEGNRALIDVKLAGPVPLLDELRGTLPYAFDLVEIGYGRITIDVAGPRDPASPAAT